MGNLAGHFYRGLERFTLGDYSLPMLLSMLCLLDGRLRREINIEYLRVLFFFPFVLLIVMEKERWRLL